MAKILVVEDNEELSRMVSKLLTFEHYQVETIDNGRVAMHQLRLSSYDLVILDWELPECTGIEILKDFRARGATTPVLMLTGQRELDHKEAGFDAGADDYLTKPFHMKELSMRVKALLRRPAALVQGTLTARDIVLDPSTFTANQAGKSLELLPKEFALLEFLLRHPNSVFSLEALLSRVWESDSTATAEAVRSTMKRLRKKIEPEDENAKPLIRTVHGVGFILEP